jgi:Rrf2 family protein
MKLTVKSEYALLGLVHLARVGGGGLVPISQIALAQSIPVKYLEQIFLTLKRARILQSTKGLGGGYQLARDPATITLAEVVRLFDGALAPTASVSEFFYQSTPIEKEEHLVAVFREIRNYVSAKLEGTTLKDIL